MEPIDPQDVENTLEDCTRDQDQFLRTANSFHVKVDDKYTRSAECVAFMITGGKIPTIDEMAMDEYGLQSMSCFDPVDLRTSPRPWELVITQGVSRIHEEFSKFFRADYFDESNNEGGPSALLRGIQQCFIDIQNRCVRATDELSKLVIETAGQRPATLKDFRTQELALERQTRLLELS
jgi:hypothetical protein